MRESPAEFRRLNLRCHSLLADVPLHDVWSVALDGGGEGRKVSEAREILFGKQGRAPNVAVRALFALRWKLGRLLGWDEARHDPAGGSYVEKLTDADRAASTVPPGTREGGFRTLYVFDHESLGEVRNATVHGFLSLALVPRSGGYTLYMGIFVKPVGGLTRVYMALIDPFRRLIVYPSLARNARRRWQHHFGEESWPGTGSR
jgi:hypothetical protein